MDDFFSSQILQDLFCPCLERGNEYFTLLGTSLRSPLKTQRGRLKKKKKAKNRKMGARSGIGELRKKKQMM